MVGDSGSTLTTPTGGTGVSWTLQRSFTTASFCSIYLWTATGISPQTFTLSVAQITSSIAYGFNCLQFSNAAVGASNVGSSTSGAPTLNLTTTATGSAIVVINGDWDALDGSTGGATPRAWRTNAGTLTEQTYSNTGVGTGYATYIGFHANAGAVGTYAVGLTVPSTQKYSIVACEVLGNPPVTATTAWFTA